jgi:hypothetical protein
VIYEKPKKLWKEIVLNLAEVKEQQLNSIVASDDEHACN